QPQPATGNAGGPGEAEPRVAVRYPSTAPNRDCEVETAEQGERGPAGIRDIPQTGVGLFGGRPVRPGPLARGEPEPAPQRRGRRGGGRAGTAPPAAAAHGHHDAGRPPPPARGRLAAWLRPGDGVDRGAAGGVGLRRKQVRSRRAYACWALYPILSLSL